MNFDEYQEFVLSKMNPEVLETPEGQLLNAVLSLCSEAGEIAGHLKKWLHQGHDLDLEYIKKELGDCQFYIASGADAVECKLSEIAEMNVVKLSKRYENGFTVEESKAKKDEVG